MTEQDTRRWVLADAFDRAAPSYDAMVALSPGYHAQLDRAAGLLIRRLPPMASTGPNVLDLGCGSGASTRALLDAWAAAPLSANGGSPAPGVNGGSPAPGKNGSSPAPGSARPLGDVIAVDASAGMIEQARTKVWPGTVRFVVDDAVAHLRTLPSSSIDGILASYLLRNVPDRDALIDEVARVLRPGGALVVHDYSVAGNPVARALWAGVCHGIVIPLAAWKRSDIPLHRYLYTSVRDFDSVDRIRVRLADAGLVDIERVEHTGWQRGLVHSLAASRPGT